MDKSNILKQIKDLLFSTENFIDAKAGEIIIRTEGEAFEEGSKVMIVTEDGVIQAGPELAGEHILDNGLKIVLDEAGVITSVEEVSEEDVIEDVVEEVTEELSEEVKEEELEEDKEVKEEEKLEEDKEDKEDKISMLEDKIKKMEEIIEKMQSETEKYSEISTLIDEKIENFIKNTPAEKQFASLKSDYSYVSDAKSRKLGNLESIKNLRKK